MRLWEVLVGPVKGHYEAAVNVKFQSCFGWDCFWAAAVNVRFWSPFDGECGKVFLQVLWPLERWEEINDRQLFCTFLTRCPLQSKLDNVFWYSYNFQTVMPISYLLTSYWMFWLYQISSTIDLANLEEKSTGMSTAISADYSLPAHFRHILDF